MPRPFIFTANNEGLVKLTKRSRSTKSSRGHNCIRPNTKGSLSVEFRDEKDERERAPPFFPLIDVLFERGDAFLLTRINCIWHSAKPKTRASEGVVVPRGRRGDRESFQSNRHCRSAFCEEGGFVRGIGIGSITSTPERYRLMFRTIEPM